MDCPVLIVGAGPSGATLALHLGLQGIKTIVLSRHRYTANTPRAHIFNQRAMEVLRDAGLDNRLSKVASSAKYMQHTSWLHSLAGEEYGRLWAWGNKPEQKGDYERASPCVMSDLPQSVLEPILVEEARKLGAEFHFYTDFVSFEDTGEAVTTMMRDRASGQTSSISSLYLIGADGARSAVLDQLGIQIDGKQLNTAFNVHIRTELSKYFAHRPGSLNWILNPDAPDWSAVGNFRMVKPWSEFVVSMHPQSKDGKTCEPSEVDLKKRLYQMIGDDSVPLEILSSFRWTINDQVAREWSKGRVYCIGDATHRHPPINGLGSNTCLSDAFNLSWKMAMVLKGYAAPELLNTLTFERKPVGDAIVKRANTGMEAHRTLWNLMGDGPEQRKRTMSILKSSTAAGAGLREQLRSAIEATDDEVQALGIQMNQIYIDSPATVVEADDTAPDFSHLKLIKDLLITTFPGYHLPHVWLAANGQSERVSILDLAGHGKFSLFTGIGGDSWCEAANSISLRGGVQVVPYTIGYGCDYMDAYRDWFKVRGVEEDGVVLCRPDHFVAWRCRRLVEKPQEKLESVLRAVLGWREDKNGHR
jgi:2-polyprenyl-6-methoxyphenol hydroxylase-like FAD-dependent oxidoreductase